MTLRDELLELEHEGWRSLCESTGAEFYGRMMTEDGVMVLAHGAAFDRREVIASLTDAPPWRRYEISDERLVSAGQDSAILVYHARAFRDPDEPAFVALMSSVYTRRPDGWRLCLYTQTPIPSTQH